MPLIPVLRWQRGRWIYESETSLVYRVCSGRARATCLELHPRPLKKVEVSIILFA